MRSSGGHARSNQRHHRGQQHGHAEADDAEDHQRAQRFAEEIADIEKLQVQQHTNMVFIEPPIEELEPLRQYLEERQIVIGRQSPRIRLVTHLDIDDTGIERVVAAIRGFFG